jgi:succinate dehydrogenase/fumarate reductase flavoprotein subunit
MTIATDVLVIGGGLAGCFSAVREGEMGADVVLVDTNYFAKTSRALRLPVLRIIYIRRT